MKVILVDDEPMAIEILTNMLLSYEDIDIIGSYTDPQDMIKEIPHLQPDVIFLDIEMGKMNGLEVAEIILGKMNNIEIVFITAYSDYAIEAFEVNAMDYLLKPIQEIRLNKTLKRLDKRLMKQEKRNMDLDKIEQNLYVNSFGNFQVYDEDGNLLQWRTKKTKELFAYLWYREGNAVNKSSIIETIFQDKNMDEGSAILHTTIYQLRHCLKKLGYSNGVFYSNGSYKLDVENKSDLEKLRRLLSFKNHTYEQIQEIIRIYKGDFLEDGYHWALSLQQNYKSIVFGVLKNFIYSQLKKKEYPRHLEIILQRMYKMEPFNEEVVEIAIEYYGINENKAELKRFFETYAKKLWEELNLKPKQSTIISYKEYMGLYRS